MKRIISILISLVIIFSSSSISNAASVTEPKPLLSEMSEIECMKYTTDGWLHKPGETQVLKYNTIPNDNDIWTNEAVYMGIYVEPNITYDSTIYFISYNGHDWGYTSNSNGTHTKSCSICGDVRTESCNLQYTNLTNTRHSVACADCNYSINSQLCTLTYSSNGNKTHKITCTLCGKVRNGTCNSITEYASSNQHYTGCSYCDAGTYSDCVGTYVHCDDVTSTDQHEYVCGVCGHQMSSSAQACTFAYRYYGVVDGSNAHIYDCSACGHIKSGPTQCTYIGTKPCLQCGSVKDQASINTSEEELHDE